jgi:hypothetical protein
MQYDRHKRQLATGRPRCHPWPMEIQPDVAAVAPKGIVPGAAADTPEPGGELDVEAFLTGIDDEHLVAVLRDALAVQRSKLN